MNDCAVCEGAYEPNVVSVTGSWAHIDRVQYGDETYFVHGATSNGLSTTWWLAPAGLCGEDV